MAACDINILIDDPKTPRAGGQTVSGTVVVKTSATVKCKALTVSTSWSTHGRGNIASGQIAHQVVFEGTWDENQEYRYPFTLPSAAWPPTYYGTYLNVGHYVHARASVPWSFDPKAQAEFPVVAAKSPEDLKPTEGAKSNSWVGWIIGIVVLLIFLPLFGILLVFIVPLVLGVAGGIWFFRIFLPGRITGPVECTLEPLRIAPGQSLKGQLKFTPKKSSMINGIVWSLKATEQCVSGSGSNRKTHRHEVISLQQPLCDSRQLSAGREEAFDLSFAVPPDAPPSMKFSDNELHWEGRLCIDIPGWPDYVREFKITVEPTGVLSSNAAMLNEYGDEVEDDEEDDEEELLDTAQANDETSSTYVDAQATENDLSFDEVAEQIVASQESPERLRMVLEAIQGQTFHMRLDLQGRMYQNPSGVELRDGQWVLGRHRSTDLQVCLWWPPGNESPRGSTFDWQQTASVIGYDVENDRLLARMG